MPWTLGSKHGVVLLLIKLLTVGKTKSKYWQAAESDFKERVKRYARLEEVIVKEARQKSHPNTALVKREEAEALLKKTNRDEFVVVLHEEGRQVKSSQLAELVREKTVRGQSRFTFIIGGPLGLAEELLARADLILSLSRLTFTHEMAKTILLEQIYRVFTILNDENYHK